MMLPFIQGLAIGLSLIVAIGPQNAFVLSQGLKKHHVFLTACLCFLSDGILITAGVAGFGSVLVLHPLLITLARWFGAAFLTFYGIKSWIAALHPGALKIDPTVQKFSVKKTVVATLSLSFLNPHAFLDTVVFIGSIAAQHAAPQRPWFGVGALTASLLWFFGLAYGARLMAPWFRKPQAWRLLDIMVGIIMLTIAVLLIVE